MMEAAQKGLLIDAQRKTAEALIGSFDQTCQPTASMDAIFPLRATKATMPELWPLSTIAWSF